jgi:thioesterase domain-containing protein/acyl carrier protein
MPVLQAESANGPAIQSAAEIRQWIIGEVADVLRVNPSMIDAAAPLESHGVDSLTAITITGKLSSWLNRNVQATLMWDYPNIEAIAEHLAGSPDKPRALPVGVIPLRTEGKRKPLFCFPGIGGHPVTFGAMAQHLGDEWPCYGLAVPGLQDSAAPLTRVEDIAGAMVKNIRLVQPTGPYQLAGYSFGGLLAYEAARQLIASGSQVSSLAIFDAFTPAGRKPRPFWQRLLVHVRMILRRPDRLMYLRHRVERLSEICHLHDDEIYRASRPKRDPAQLKVRQISKLNRLAAADYRPAPYPGSALFFVAANLPKHDPFYKTKHDGGWGELCATGVSVIKLPGNHFNILDADHARAAADLLRTYLSTA